MSNTTESTGRTLDYAEPVTRTGPSKGALWTGRVISALPVLMLVFSAVMKFLKPKEVMEGFVHLGYPERLALGLGILELACTLLYVIPQTAVLGAILLTAYLGGATASHVRIGEPFYTPIILCVLVWLGLFLRDPRLRALIPLRRRPA
jgi:DoxX-like protein